MTPPCTCCSAPIDGRSGAQGDTGSTPPAPPTHRRQAAAHVPGQGTHRARRASPPPTLARRLPQEEHPGQAAARGHSGGGSLCLQRRGLHGGQAGARPGPGVVQGAGPGAAGSGRGVLPAAGRRHGRSQGGVWGGAIRNPRDPAAGVDAPGRPRRSWPPARPASRSFLPLLPSAHLAT